MDWLGNNVKTFKVKGITIIANRNNGMVIGLDREGEEVVDLLYTVNHPYCSNFKPPFLAARF